ncbi:MAG TPA: DUF4097 domain-containing protein [Firmicutes bacterium]|nr:DUF4097 domain-containing protein [Bacillota bacterium]
MKKITALLFTIAGLLSFALAGCSNSDTFTAKSYERAAGEVDKITVSAEDREIEVTKSSDDKIRVRYFDGENEYLEINLSDAKELTVELKYDKNWTDYIGSKPSAEYRKITIEIPDGAVASLTVGTTNEDITVSGLSFAKDVSLTSNGGDIVCDMLGVGEAVSLVSKNGGISGTIVGGMDDFSIACRIKKGECNLPESKEGGEKSFSADCNNGDINIKFIR